MADNQRSTPLVSVTIPANLPLPAPEGANFFHFSVVGNEVHMLVGTLNFLRLLEARQRLDSNESTVIVPDITHRFLLSPQGFEGLRLQIGEITPLVAAGAAAK